MWLKDVAGVYQICNPAFEHFYGASQPDIAGKTDFDFVEPDVARFFQQRDREAMAAVQSTKSEEWLTSPLDGRLRLFETIKTPVRDRNGKVLGVARDITERERANQKLALIDFALNRVKEAVYLADEHGFFHYVNDEACRALEYTHDDLLKLRVLDIDCDLTEPAQWQAFWDELKAHKTMTQESCNKTRSGKTFPVEININYFRVFRPGLCARHGARHYGAQAGGKTDTGPGLF